MLTFKSNRSRSKAFITNAREQPVQIIVARGDMLELFDAIENAFNEIMSFAKLGIELAWVSTVSARKKNYRRRSMVVDHPDQGPRIVGFVGDHLFNLKARATVLDWLTS